MNIVLEFGLSSIFLTALLCDGESLPHALSVQSVVLNAGVKYTTTTCFLTLPCSLYHTNYLHEILPRDPVTPVANVTMHVLGQSQQSWQCWVSKVLARGVVCIDTGAGRGYWVTTATPTLTQVVARKQGRS